MNRGDRTPTMHHGPRLAVSARMLEHPPMWLGRLVPDHKTIAD
jgi:hypothetical protein